MPKQVSALVPEECYDELVSQARALGYVPGSVTVYLHDRLVQLADPLVFTALPPTVPSWPKNRRPPPKRWFLREGDSGHHLTRRRARPGERRDPG